MAYERISGDGLRQLQFGDIGGGHDATRGCVVIQDLKKGYEDVAEDQSDTRRGAI